MIAVVERPSLNGKEITFPPAGNRGDRGCAFSPDGRTIAYVRSTGTYADDLFTLSLADGFTVKGDGSMTKAGIRSQTCNQRTR